MERRDFIFRLTRDGPHGSGQRQRRDPFRHLGCNSDGKRSATRYPEHAKTAEPEPIGEMTNIPCEARKSWRLVSGRRAITPTVRRDELDAMLLRRRVSADKLQSRAGRTVESDHRLSVGRAQSPVGETAFDADRDKPVPRDVFKGAVHFCSAKGSATKGSVGRGGTDG